MSQVTMLLDEVQNGDDQAVHALFELVYDELRRIAAKLMAGERASHTLQATALVNEAYLKLVGPEQLRWENRRHFYLAAARAMRQILVDHARGKRAAKRGGGQAAVALDDVQVAAPAADVDWLALDEALTRLEHEDERRHEVVMCRYFGGLSNKQIAEMLGVTEKTVQRDWDAAKLFLLAEMESGTH